MPRSLRSVRTLAATSLVAALAVSCASPQDSASGDADEVKVALVTSTSGPLASYGKQYLQGFEAGLDHATDGTGEVDGRKITVLKDDDGGDPAKGVSLVKKRIGQEVRIVAGSVASGVATQVAPVAEQNETLFISGPAATDEVTGANEFTFRSGRQTYQDVVTAQAILDEQQGEKKDAAKDQRVVVLAQDNAFGQANVAAVRNVLGGDGTTVRPVLASPSATDLTPTISKVKSAKPDMVFVAWAGDTASSMWNTLDQQGVLDSSTVVTGLDIRSSYPVFGKARDKVTLLAHYVAGATDTEEANAMRAYFKKKNWQEDLFSPDGFTAAQMVVQAVREGGDDLDPKSMAQALKGYSFSGVKGTNTVRAEDHALLQPMFQAEFDDSGKPNVVTTFEPKRVAPAPKKMD